MYQDNIVLCGASAYEQKFYFNQDFNALPVMSLPLSVFFGLAT